jgi:hypothetical protein
MSVPAVATRVAGPLLSHIKVFIGVFVALFVIIAVVLFITLLRTPTWAATVQSVNASGVNTLVVQFGVSYGSSNSNGKTTTICHVSVAGPGSIEGSSIATANIEDAGPSLPVTAEVTIKNINLGATAFDVTTSNVRVTCP